MVPPKKRFGDNRSQRRASQRVTPPKSAQPAADVEVTYIPRPPESCAPYHWYWCDGHEDWHHHDEFVVTAIERSFPTQD